MKTINCVQLSLFCALLHNIFRTAILFNVPCYCGQNLKEGLFLGHLCITYQLILRRVLLDPFHLLVFHRILMKLDEVVVHMEYKLQLYKVSSKSDEDYESFLNGPLFNGWILDAGEFGVKGAKRSFIVHHKSKIILLSLFLTARSRWSLLCTLNNYVYRTELVLTGVEF